VGLSSGMAMPFERLVQAKREKGLFCLDML
jgi:hypothetical protein